jgi:S-adenosylmethionine hydrolase
MVRPIVALLTDFGTRDHYAGVMKGVVLGICPDVTLVDISHDLPPHDVLFATQELAATAKFFPAGTIFLVVVDPGVGTARRGLAAEAGDRKFVAPDNGVLTAVFQETPPRRVVELTERRYARPTVSRTFEGRDRFAPAAGFLAKGLQLDAFGRPVHDYHLLDLPVPEMNGSVLRGRVVRIDRFVRACGERAQRRALERRRPYDRSHCLHVRGSGIRRNRRAVRQHRSPGVFRRLQERSRAVGRRGWRSGRTQAPVMCEGVE